jgi:hypothetical protein
LKYIFYSNLFFNIKVEMGIFSKLGGAFKTFLSDPGEYIKQGAIKYGPAIEKVSGALKYIPGPVGLISAGVNTGIKAVQDAVKAVPNPAVQKQLTNELNKSSSVTVTPEGKVMQTPQIDNYLGPAIGNVIRGFYRNKKKRNKKK